jgi:hypothetical protein
VHFRSDRSCSGHPAHTLDPSKMTHFSHPFRRRVASVRGTTLSHKSFRLTPAITWLPAISNSGRGPRQDPTPLLDDGISNLLAQIGMYDGSRVSRDGNISTCSKPCRSVSIRTRGRVTFSAPSAAHSRASGFVLVPLAEVALMQAVSSLVNMTQNARFLTYRFSPCGS